MKFVKKFFDSFVDSFKSYYVISGNLICTSVVWKPELFPRAPLAGSAFPQSPEGGENVNDKCTAFFQRSDELVRVVKQLRSALFNARKGNPARASLETWESFISYYSNHFQASACRYPDFFFFHLHLYALIKQAALSIMQSVTVQSVSLTLITGGLAPILCLVCFVYSF